MPIPVTKYRCSFKCGRLAAGKKKDMENHEAHCYKNPINKTCETCVNRIYEVVKGDLDERSYVSRGCKLMIMDEWLIENEELIKIKKSAIGHLKPLFMCPNHNEAEATSVTDSYLIGLKEKMLAAFELTKESEMDNFLQF